MFFNSLSLGKEMIQVQSTFSKTLKLVLTTSLFYSSHINELELGK